MKRRVFPIIYLVAGLGVGFLCGAVITVAHGDLLKFNYDQVVGQVGETTITRSQLAERAIAVSGAKILDSEMKHRAYVLEAARQAGIMVNTEEIDQRIGEYRKLLMQYKELADLLGSESAFNMTPHWILEDQFRTAMSAEKMLKVKVSDADVSHCFVSTLNRFYRPPMVKLILIATNTEVDARRAWNRLRDGEKPGDLAEIYSTADELKKSRGDIGWVPRSKMSDQVADAIFGAHDGKGLKPKEFTEVINYSHDDQATGKTTTEYLIFYVDGYQPEVERQLNDPGVREAVTLVQRVLTTAKLEDEWYRKQERAMEWKRVKDLLDPQAVPVRAGTPAAGAGSK